jgi:hypothetical protein
VIDPLNGAGGFLAMACPVCLTPGAQGSQLVDAALLGVIALLAVTVGVLGGFAAFIRHLMHLSRTQPVEGGPLAPANQEDTP